MATEPTLSVTERFTGPDGAIDHLGVQARWQELMQIFTARTYAEADYPALCAEAIECTRILRRTNTGPAKAKAPSKRKTALTQDQARSMLLD